VPTSFSLSSTVLENNTTLELSDRVQELLNSAYVLRVNNINKSIELVNKGLELSRLANNKSLIAHCLSKLSLFYMITGKNEMSLNCAEEAIRLFEMIGDVKGLAEAKYSIAGTLYKTDQFYLGLVKLGECLDIYKKLDDHHNISRVYKSMGTIYEYFGDTSAAIRAYELAIEAGQIANDPNLVSNAYNPLSGIYLNQGRKDEAKQIIDEAIEMKRLTGDIRGLAFSLYGRGKIGLHEKAYKLAEEDFRNAIQIHEEMNEHLGLAMAMRKLSAVYLERNMLSLARETAEKVLSISNEYEIGLSKVDAYHLLYLIAKKDGKIEEALANLEQYSREKESLLNDRSTKMIQSFETVSRMESLQKEAEEQKEKNLIVEKKNKELDAFFHRVSHDLKGSVTSLYSVDALLRKQLSNTNSINLLDMSLDQVKRINHILDELITLTRVTHIKSSHETINFNQIIDDCLKALSTSDNFDRIRIEKHLSFDAEYKAPWILVNTIIQNLIENGIKYANLDAQDPFVKIEITEDHSLLKIRVTDNGIGMTKEAGDNIFEMFYRASTNTQGSGLGLYILSRAVEQLGGTVDVMSELSHGTTFTVLLPMD
jgi:signal transduction histidine kinase